MTGVPTEPLQLTLRKELTALPSVRAMTLAIPIRRVWRWINALYKFLFRHLRPTLNPNVFTSLFRRFVFVYKIVRIKWEAWFGKQKYLKPPSSNPGTSDMVESGDQDLKEADIDETVIPLDKISCSLYPHGTGLHNSARSSRILNASESRSSHNPDIVSRSQNASWSSQIAESSTGSPLGVGYMSTIQPTSPRRRYSMSSPELGRPQWHPVDLHDAMIQGPHPVSQILAQPRSGSPVESIELLSLGETYTCQTHTDDLEIPALNHHLIYPTLPELFQRYEKRRRM